VLAQRTAPPKKQQKSRGKQALAKAPTSLVAKTTWLKGARRVGLWASVGTCGKKVHDNEVSGQMAGCVVGKWVGKCVGKWVGKWGNARVDEQR
jgi:hypothetical protein